MDRLYIPKHIKSGKLKTFLITTTTDSELPKGYTWVKYNWYSKLKLKWQEKLLEHNTGERNV